MAQSCRSPPPLHCSGGVRALSLSLSESFGDDSFVGEKVNNLCRRRGREGEGGPANGEGIK